MFWLMLVWLGCAAHVPVPDSSADVVRFRVQITGDFSAVTQGQPETGAVAPASQATLDLRMHWVPTRQFRDGSMGRQIFFDEAQMLVTRDSRTSAAPLTLAGRSVEIRTFPNGEILDVSWVERVAGAGRSMDVFDLVFPAISPSPPPLKKRESAKRRIIWPFRDGNRLRWDHIVNAVWSHVGEVEHQGRRAVQVEYAGPWSTDGRTRPPRLLTTFSGAGQASGTILFDQRTAELLRHEFLWEREVRIGGDGGVLTQTQNFSGVVESQP